MPKNKTAEDVIKEMNTDKSYYAEFMEDLAIKCMNDNPKTLQSWLDWFNYEGEFADGSVTRPEDIQ